MKHWNEVEAQYQWSRKGKKYKTKYFAALGKLFEDSPLDGLNLTLDERSQNKASEALVKGKSI